jgi:hypothetical protein
VHSNPFQLIPAYNQFMQKPLLPTTRMTEFYIKQIINHNKNQPKNYL